MDTEIQYIYEQLFTDFEEDEPIVISDDDEEEETAEPLENADLIFDDFEEPAAPAEPAPVEPAHVEYPSEKLDYGENGTFDLSCDLFEFEDTPPQSPGKFGTL